MNKELLWDYRLVLRENARESAAILEVYYDKRGNILSYVNSPTFILEEDDIKTLTDEMNSINKAFEKPILTEKKGELYDLAT